MTNVLVKTPMQYLDRATSALKQIGITPPKGEDAPINSLLQKISDLDQDKIAVIARTLGQAGVFNERQRAHAGHGDWGSLPPDGRGLQFHPR